MNDNCQWDVHWVWRLGYHRERVERKYGEGSSYWTGIVGAKWGIITFVGSAREQLEEGRERQVYSSNSAPTTSSPHGNLFTRALFSFIPFIDAPK